MHISTHRQQQQLLARLAAGCWRTAFLRCDDATRKYPHRTILPPHKCIHIQYKCAKYTSPEAGGRACMRRNEKYTRAYVYSI